MRQADVTTDAAARRMRHVYLLAMVIIGLLSYALASAAAFHTGFNPDESRWLSRAHYLADFLDPFGPNWDDRYMTRGQPPLGSYTMGAGLLAQGRDLETNPPWDFSITWEANIAIGNKPVPADLLAGRRTSAVLVALTAVTLIGVTRVFVSFPWALLGGVFFAVHPFAIYIGSIAMSDAIFGLLIALAALAAAWFARNPGWPRAVLVGVLLGLGGATKLSPLAVAAGLCGAALALLANAAWRARRPPTREAAFAVSGVIVALAAAATFVAVYPYLWPDPIGRTRNLFAFRVEEMATQAADWPVMAVPTRTEAVRRVGINFTERFNLAASLVSLTGRSAPLIVRLPEVALAGIGVIVMVATAIRDGPYSPRAMALAVLGGQAIVTILGMRSEFDRYHLPMALLGTVAAAVAVHWLAEQAQGALRRWRAEPANAF